MRPTGFSPLILALACLLAATPCSWAQTPDAGLKLEVTRQNGRFRAIASFQTPLSVCQAFESLASHDTTKHLQGVTASKMTRTAPNKVLVERWGSESILLVKVKVHTLLEYTEYPPNRMEFVQLAGDMKSYTGSWEIVPEDGGTRLNYESTLEPDSLVPGFIIQHFVTDRLRKRLLDGIEYMTAHPPAPSATCGT